MSAQRDVIIAGGGSVGLTLACALAAAGFTVTVIEARAQLVAPDDGDVDLRVFAITRASQQIFSALGAWTDMQRDGISPFRAMQVWDAGGSGSIGFDAADIGEPVLGHIIEQRVIQRGLAAVAESLPTLTLLHPAEVVAVAVDEDAVTVTLADGGTLSARLLVGADGVDSRVRELTGLPVRLHDYQQQAVVAAVATELPHAETAWQRFLPAGPLAFLPLRDGRCSIVWSTATEHAQALLAMDEADFCAALGDAFAHRLGAITAGSRRATFPLQRLHAEDYCSARVALVGDAAHAIHPLAGQGVNLGLLDAAMLAQVVGDARRRGRDIGGIQALRRYERARKADNLRMMLAMDGFKLLFGESAAPLRVLRNAGLSIVDRTGFLKHLFMRHAMGTAGELPRLACVAGVAGQ